MLLSPAGSEVKELTVPGCLILSLRDALPWICPPVIYTQKRPLQWDRDNLGATAAPPQGDSSCVSQNL